MTTTTERGSFIRAICEQPADDTARLVFADWLDENGEPERAEFVRLQIALARVVCEWEAAGKQPCERWNAERPVYRMMTICPACQRGFRLRDRERELNTAKNHLAWGSARALWAAGLKMPYVGVLGLPNHVGEVFSRGFVSAVSLPCDAFVRHAASLFRAHPIEAVTLTDREPRHRPVSDTYYWAYLSHNDVSETADRYVLPACLRVATQRQTERGAFDSQALARAALSLACVLHGRKLADLPPLPEPEARP